MKPIFKHFIFYILLSFSFLNTTSCSNRDDTVSCFPNSNINVTLSLTLPAYYELQSVGGWLYISEQQSGTRGLIVVRTSTGFKVYDRNAPHICPGSDTTLKVVDDISITCPSDGAQWILLTGQPTEVANVSPKTYSYSFNASTQVLTIYN